MAYPAGARPLQLLILGTAVDRTRTLRGAVCGVCAAAVWALEQPLDKLLFESGYDDVEGLANEHRTYGLGISTGRVQFEFHTGSFDPVVSDGEHIYLTGTTGLYALYPG